MLSVLRKILILFILFTGCSKYEIVTIDGQALGTYFAIKYLDKGYDKKKFQKGIDSIFNVINNSMSTYISS